MCGEKKEENLFQKEKRFHCRFAKEFVGRLCVCVCVGTSQTMNYVFGVKKKEENIVIRSIFTCTDRGGGVGEEWSTWSNSKVLLSC